MLFSVLMDGRLVAPLAIFRLWVRVKRYIQNKISKISHSDDKWRSFYMQHITVSVFLHIL